MIKTRKIGIIGVGNVGSHVAFSLATQGEVDELVLIDKIEKKAHAEALDVEDAISYLPHHVEAYAGTYEDLVDADILVMSAGPLPDANEQSRLDTLGDTIEVLDDILPKLKASKFSGIIINISNPADVVATYIKEYLNYPKEKIVSTGCVLDSARLQARLSELLEVNRRSIQAYCFGEHGFSAMISWSNVLVGGQPIDEYIKVKNKAPINHEEVLEEVKDRGYVILRGKGSTEFGIATSLVEVVRAIYHDEHKMLPASAYLEGEYGQSNLFTSIPVVIGKDGVEDIIEWEMTLEEKKDFDESCAIIKDNVKKASEYSKI